ncbi:MAG: hypothetical protein AAB656_01855 [Patescibacteria group bacterium]
MNTTTLQIPISKDLKASATAVAKDFGFSSLQEVTRVLLTKLAKRELNVSVEQFPAVMLSAKAEKRYAKMDEDFKKGKNWSTAKDVDDLMRQLHGN